MPKAMKRKNESGADQFADHATPLSEVPTSPKTSGDIAVNNTSPTPTATNAVTVETSRGSYLAEWHLNDDTGNIAVRCGGHRIHAHAGENNAANEAIARDVATRWLNNKGPAVDSEQLSHFAWLIDNLDGREIGRLEVFWDWAGEMVHFQNVANRTGKPVEYFQRGRALRILLPQNEQEAA